MSKFAKAFWSGKTNAYSDQVSIPVSTTPYPYHDGKSFSVINLLPSGLLVQN